MAADRLGHALMVVWQLIVYGGLTAAFGTPLAAAVAAARPSRATRWAAWACLVMVALLVGLLGLFVWDTRPPADLEPRQEWADDPSVTEIVQAVLVLAVICNLVGWAVARWRVPPRPSR